MKNNILVLLFLFLLSCGDDDSQTKTIGQSEVKEVVFNDLFTDAVTKINFQYKEGKVQTVNWDFSASGDSYAYQEERFYSGNGNLDSLKGSRFNGGIWNLSYEYKDGVRYKIESTRNSTTTVTTFVEYNDTRPVRVENLYSVYGVYEGFNYPYYTTFKFDAAGNLINQKNTYMFGSNTEERTTTYSTELNPLRNLIETPLPQALEHYDDLAFYFSPNLPSFVEANYPYDNPVHNRITFEYEKDTYGRVIQIKALRPDNNSTRYTLDITYY